MNCASCGEPAVLLTQNGIYIEFAFCMKCAKKRFRNNRWGSYKIDVDDLENKLSENELKEVR